MPEYSVFKVRSRFMDLQTPNPPLRYCLVKRVLGLSLPKLKRLSKHDSRVKNLIYLLFTFIPTFAFDERAQML